MTESTRLAAAAAMLGFAWVLPPMSDLQAAELNVLADAGLMPVHRRLVLNFSDSTSGITPRDAARIVGTDFDVVVPRSTSVLLASNLGVPLIHHDVRDAAAKAIRTLVTDFEPSAMPTRRRIHRRSKS